MQNYYNQKLTYPDLQDYIGVLTALAHDKKYESRSEYEKNHTCASIKVIERILKNNDITDEQRKGYETTIRLLKEAAKDDL